MNAKVAHDPKFWQVEQLRLTVFTKLPLNEDMLAAWGQVTGVEPESKTSKTALGIYTAEGAYNNARLFLNIGPGRVDWLLTPIGSVEDPTPTLGALAETEEVFLGLLKPWLERLSIVVIRIAHGIVLRSPTPDRVSGYKVVADLVPALKIDAENSSDLTYQINRPRKSKVVENLKLNRLSKWGVIHFSFFDAVSRIQGNSNQHFCRLELDINTDADQSNDLANKSVDLVGELIQLGGEIAANGDTP